MKAYIISGAAILMAGACQSPTGERAEMAEGEVDVRQGEEVSQVCFSRQIRSWSELGRDSVLIEKGVNDHYKLDLIGTCDPQNAFTSIGLVSRGASSCLSRGDRLVTDDSFGGSCSIMRIYEWNEDADEEEAEAEAS